MRNQSMKYDPPYSVFKEMAARGRLHKVGEADELKPTKDALQNANGPVDYGRLYGYSEDDIAHFYEQRRGGTRAGYLEYIHDLDNATIEPREFNQDTRGRICVAFSS